LPRASGLHRSAGAGSLLPACRPHGRYAHPRSAGTRRRVSWRVLVPPCPPEPCERPRKRYTH
jgi:hypothetical protein